MAKAKAKAKRYTPEEKEEILNYIAAEGRGGQTKAVAKFGVTAATIATWKKKAAGGFIPGSSAKNGSKELQAVTELANIIAEIDSTEARLESLNKQYKIAKAKI